MNINNAYDLPVIRELNRTDLQSFKKKAVKFKELDWEGIQRIVTHWQESINKYKEDKTQSLDERVQVYESLSSRVNVIANHIHSSKSFFQKFLSLFIYLSNEEREFGTFVKSVKRSKSEAQNTFNKTLGVPATKLAANTLLNTHESSGLHEEKSIAGNTDDPWNSRWCKFKRYLNKSYLNSEYGKDEFKYCAFRLVGKHKTSSSFANSEYVSRAIANLIEDMESFKGFLRGYRQCENDLNEVEFVLQELNKMASHEIDKSVVLLVKQFSSDSETAERNRKLAEIFSGVIQNLQVNQSFSFPGGYRSVRKGHAVIYEIKRKSNDKFRFFIHNTGEGARDYQGMLQSAVSTDHVRRVFFDDLDRDQVVNIDLYEGLIKFATLVPDNFGMRKIDSFLQSKFEKKPKLGDLYELQTNGTCSFDSILCWLSNKMSRPLFHLFNIYITKKALSRVDWLDGVQFESDKEMHGTNALTKDNLKKWGRETLEARCQPFKQPKEDQSWVTRVISVAASVVDVKTQPPLLRKKDCVKYRPLVEEITGLV